MLLILHAFTCFCRAGTQAPSARMHAPLSGRHTGTFGTHARASVGQAPSARMHAPLSGRHTGTFGTHARASVGQAHRHLRHACTRLCQAGTQAPSARMHSPLSGRHTGTFGTHARASVEQAHRHLRHACTHLSGRYLRGTLFNMSSWHVYHYPAYTLNGRHTLRSILFSMA